jgi:4-hydroxy-tetrahydrodipicolinate synthase
MNMAFSVNELQKFPIWTALITPFFEDGRIDFETLEQLVMTQSIAGNGLLLLGSTGEGLNIPLEQKKAVISFCTRLDLDVPIMAGLGGFLLEEQLHFMHYCDAEGVDAFLLVAPIYAKPKKEGQLAWFSHLMNATKTPCMLYNVPSRTGIHMDPEVPAHIIATFPHYLGLKEASGNLDHVRAFKAAAPKSPLYCGDDNLIKEFVAEGAIGHVSVASNVWPEKTHLYWKLCTLDSSKLLKEWVPIVDTLFHAPSPIPAKAIMQHKGQIPSAHVRLPLDINDLQPETLQTLIEADKVLQDWES